MHGEISTEFTFDAGHRVVGHKGKCARLHGHTYKIHVMCAGEVQDSGFVVDFGDIKDLVKAWDHHLLLWNQDPTAIGGRPSTAVGEAIYWSQSIQDELGIIRLPFNPTAENMAAWLAYSIRNAFSLDAVMVELWETPGSMARSICNAETISDFTDLLRGKR